MILQLEEGEQLIGRSHLILKKGNYIKKYYPNFFVLAAKGDVNRHNFYINHIEKSTYFMKIVHPDLYVSDETDNNFYCVTQNYIDHNDAEKYGYVDNINVYLNIVNTLGYDYAKRDMQCYNILYRKSDDKPFCIDWDSHIELKSKQHAYHYYKEELTSPKWQEAYDISILEMKDIFDREWKNV